MRLTRAVPQNVERLTEACIVLGEDGARLPLIPRAKRLSRAVFKEARWRTHRGNP